MTPIPSPLETAASEGSKDQSPASSKPSPPQETVLESSAAAGGTTLDRLPGGSAHGANRDGGAEGNATTATPGTPQTNAASDSSPVGVNASAGPTQAEGEDPSSDQIGRAHV